MLPVTIFGSTALWFSTLSEKPINTSARLSYPLFKKFSQLA